MLGKGRRGPETNPQFPGIAPDKMMQRLCGQDRLWSQASWVQILALPFKGCVTFATLVDLSVPVFLINELWIITVFAF